MILGQVVDSATGAPCPEAIVQLTLPAYLDHTCPTTPKGRVMADGDGRFFFMDLPAGEYFAQATKDGLRARGVQPTPALGPSQSSRSAKANGARTSRSACGSTRSSPAR